MVLFSGSSLGNLFKPPSSVVQALEPETITYFAAMDAAGESYWPSEKALIDNLVKSLKSASLWVRPTLLWMPVGASLSGAMRALKHPLGVGTAMINNGFTEATWDRLLGLDGRGVTHWIDTRTTEFDYVPSVDTHIAVDVFAKGLGLNPSREIGNIDGDRFQLILSISYANNTSFYRSFSHSTGFESGPEISNPGSIVATLKDSLSHLIFNNEIKASFNSSGLPESPSAGRMALFRGSSYTHGAPESSDKGFASASIGKGFTQAEALQYSSILQSARTARAALTPP